jgi:hypothetical protein
MPCAAHVKRKQGDCVSCDGCRGCKPVKGCKSREYHQHKRKRGRPTNSKKPAKKARQNRQCAPLAGDLYVNSDESLSTDASISSNTSDKSVSSEIRKETSRVLKALLDGAMNLTPESTVKRRDAEDALLYSADSPRKNRLLKLLILLDIPITDANRNFPVEGFSKSSSRCFRRAKQLRNSIVQAVDELLCPDDSLLLSQQANPLEVDTKNRLEVLRRNTETVALTGHNTVALIANAILAGSYTRAEMQSNLRERKTQITSHVPKIRLTVGEKRAFSLRKLCSVIIEGLPPPEKEYKFRVDPTKIRSAMEYLQQSLQIRPGSTRTVSCGGHAFINMPVYQRGGMAVEKMHSAYKESCGGEDSDYLGKHTFCELTKMMTKRGECQTGLSTYFVRLR